MPGVEKTTGSTVDFKGQRPLICRDLTALFNAVVQKEQADLPREIRSQALMRVAGYVMDMVDFRSSGGKECALKNNVDFSKGWCGISESAAIAILRYLQTIGDPPETYEVLYGVMKDTAAIVGVAFEPQLKI